MLYDFLRSVYPTEHICILDYRGKIIALGRKIDIELKMDTNILHYDVIKTICGKTLYIYLGKDKRW